jgi:hypothetical protein
MTLAVDLGDATSGRDFRECARAARARIGASLAIEFA